MQSNVHPHSETQDGTYLDGFAANSFVPPIFEDPVLGGHLAYEYLAREASGTSGPYFSEWSIHAPSNSGTYTGFFMPPSQTNNLPLSPTFPLTPPPQEPPSPSHTRQPASRTNCRNGIPSFNEARRRWYCSVCQEVFHNKYECERHIGNVGKQATCLACGKIVCARKDNRKRHYNKYCKRMDLGKHGVLSFEEAFAEL